jgi:capsular polysaccharide export protein
LTNKWNLPEVDEARPVEHRHTPMLRVAPMAASSQAFLRIPPFPGAKVRAFTTLGSARSDSREHVESVRRWRVGGTYWAAQPLLPANYVLVRSAAALEAAQALVGDGSIVLWSVGDTPANCRDGLHIVRGECDPWHMLSSATGVIMETADELRPIAALLGVPVHLFSRSNGSIGRDRTDAHELVAQAIPAELENPFTGEPMSSLEAVELCGFWRSLIDSNRGIAGGLGFAFWKQAHVAPLLWDGSGRFPFMRSASEVTPGQPLAVWQARVPQRELRLLQRTSTPLIEVEDGFLRSRGLGADCIPPLSITVDRAGAHFDPSRPSELEQLLQQGEFEEALLERASQLMRVIVEGGIGKYEQGSRRIERPAGQRKHILVPGQVEDDRSIVAGGCGLTSNLELLKRVREHAPDAYILYKPHPDVLAGHRRGDHPDRTLLRYADRIVGDLAIGSLIAMVDEVHVNTSLAGFEALLRGKRVTTYGVPFYAGWGLTDDLGPIPERRTATRTIEELVAATLLIYPRYLDPVTGLPCPAEVVVARLGACEAANPGLLVGMRRFQGRLMRRLRSLVQ